MKILSGLMVFSTLVASAPVWACEDGAPEVSVVGLLDGNRLLVREERFARVQINLYVLDLAKNQVTHFATILGNADPESEREKLRGARWKAAESELKKQGLVLKTLMGRPLPFELAGATITSTRSGNDETGCVQVKLVAVRGNVSRTIDSTAFCGSSDTTSYSGAVVTPDEKYLIPTLNWGCADFPTRWMKAIAVASFAAPQERK